MIARGSAPYILPAPIAMVVVGMAVLLWEDMLIATWALPLAPVFLWTVFQFRDPERTPGRGIVSPADGRVVSVDRTRGIVVIAGGLGNVRVQRAPVPGRIVSADWTEDGGWEAVLDGSAGVVRVRLEPGMGRPRIVPYLSRGHQVSKGQRLALVPWGPRTEVTIPAACPILVEVGRSVRAGETQIAQDRAFAHRPNSKVPTRSFLNHGGATDA